MSKWIAIVLLAVLGTGVCRAQEVHYVDVCCGSVRILKQSIQLANDWTDPTELRLTGVFEFGIDDQLPNIKSDIRIRGYGYEETQFKGMDGGPDRLLHIKKGASLTLTDLVFSDFAVPQPCCGLDAYSLIENAGQLRIIHSEFNHIQGNRYAGRFPVAHPIIFNRGNLFAIQTVVVDSGYTDGEGGWLGNEGFARLERVTIRANGIGTPIDNSGELELVHFSYQGDEELSGRGRWWNYPVYSEFGATTMVNSIVAETEGTWCDQVTSLGHNLVESPDCDFHAPGDIVGRLTGLLPLAQQDSRPVLPLSAASPAVDSADPAFCTTLDPYIPAFGTIIDGDRDGTVVCDRGAIEFVPNRLSEGGANGLYYDPEMDGHYLSVIDAGQVTIVIWNTFDTQGKQAWLVAVGQLVEGRSLIADAFYNPTGILTDAGAADVSRDVPWGTIQLQMDSCEGGRLFYNSDLPDFTSGQFSFTRVVAMAQIGCED